LEKQFNNATKDKKVSFLYLSNDILQNSKRKGGEFVNEFWRVLPGLLKDVYDNGGEHGKKVVARLVSCLLFHHYSLHFKV
jgi:regulator of Ty1 transposition protein 103